jgi:hypothetical protein
MLPIVLLALAAPVAAPAAAPAAPARPLARTCAPPAVAYAKKGWPVAAPQRLGELPPAREYLAVVRHVGGCPEPAIVRSGIGGR